MLKVDRFVSPRGAALQDDFAPEEDNSLLDIVPLSTLCDRKASLVLGEPGAGKSTSLARLEEVIREADWVVQLIDLKDFVSGDSLARAFDDLSSSSPNESVPRILLIDSVDETPGLIRNYVRFFERRLTRLVSNGWRVLAVCRTAESVHALDALFDRLDDGAVHVLLPLKRSDAISIASSQGIEGEVFMDQVARRRLDSLAAIPFTLDLLCRIYQADSAFPESRTEVFERAISLILSEVTNEGYTPAPLIPLAPIRQRVASERLAAFAAFTETTGFALFSPGEPSSGLHTEIVVATEFSDGAKIGLDNEDLQALLRTPLFADSGVNERQFAHRRLRDFLAAKFIVRQQLAHHQLASMLTVADGGTIPPQMADIATWLVALQPISFDWLIDSDPISLVRNRITEDLPALAPRLISELLARADEADRALSWRDDLSGLNHGALVEQLQGLRSMTESEQAVALRIIRFSYVPGLEEDLLALIEQPNYPERTRQLAAAVLADNDPEKLAHVKLFAPNFFTEDTSAELRGTILRAIWHRLPIRSLLRLLIKPPKDLIGSYSLFIHSLESQMNEDLARELLMSRATQRKKSVDGPATRQAPRGRGLSSLYDKALSVSMRSTALDPQLFAAISRILRRRLSRGRDKLPFAREAVDPPVYRRLIRELARESDEGLPNWYRLWSASDQTGTRLVDRSDLDWIAEFARKCEDEGERTTWTELIDRLLDSAIADDFEWAWNQRSSSLWPHLRYRFVAIDLSSAEADSARERWKLLHNAEREPGDRAMDTTEYLDNIRRLIADTRLDPELFILLSRWLDLDLDSRRFQHNVEPDLLSLPNTKLLNEGDHQELLQLAFSYLKAWFDKLPTIFKKDTAYYHILAAYQAIYTIESNAPDLLAKLPTGAWPKLNDAILEFFNWSPAQSEPTIRAAIFRRSAAADGQALNDAIRRWLRRMARHDSSARNVTDLDQYVDSRLSRDLQAVIRTGTHGRGTIAELFLRIDRDKATAWMNRRVLTSAQADEVTVLLSSLLEVEPEVGFELASEMIRARREFAKEVLLQVAARERFGQRRIYEVDPEVRIRLFEELAELFPPSEDVVQRGMHAITPREDLAEWRQGLMLSVANGGTREGFQAITDLVARRADLDLAWVLTVARESYRISGWSPLSVSELTEVLKKIGARLARSNDDVLSIVVDALAEAQDWLTGETPQAFSLWDIIGDQRAPKDENRISDWYCHALRLLLDRTGLIINREVEVRNVAGRGVGRRQDIRVEVRDPDSGDHFVSVIEVKGIWNTGVRTNLLDQLADQYLTVGGLTHGVYLVVEVSPDRMSSSSKAQTSRNNSRDLLPHLLTQAKSVEPRLTIRPVVHTADMPL